MVKTVIKKMRPPVGLGAGPKQLEAPLHLPCPLRPLFPQLELFQGCNPEKLMAENGIIPYGLNM